MSSFINSFQMFAITAWFVPLLVIALAGLIPGLFIPKFVLGCVFEAERKRGLPTQFLMPDLMWLTLLVQIGLAAVRILSSNGNDPMAMTFYGFVLIAVPLVWWHCVKVLSRAGVLDFWKRGLFLVVVVPLTLVLTIGGGFVGAALPITIAESVFGDLNEKWIAFSLAFIAVAVVGVVSLRTAANYCIGSLDEATELKFSGPLHSDSTASK